MDGDVATIGANNGIPRTMALSAQGQMLLGQYSRSWMGCSDHLSVGHVLTSAAPSSLAFATMSSLSSLGSMGPHLRARIKRALRQASEPEHAQYERH